MKAITVNYDNKEIVISSAFKKKGLTPGTHEYDQLQAVRRDFPDFALKVKEFKKNTNQEHFKGLDYDYMRYYINKVERGNAPAVLVQFEDMVDISKCHSASKRYPVIKSWFLERYPDVAKFGLTKEEIEESKAKAELRKIEAAEKAAKVKREVSNKKLHAIVPVNDQEESAA